MQPADSNNRHAARALTRSAPAPKDASVGTGTVSPPKPANSPEHSTSTPESPPPAAAESPVETPGAEDAVARAESALADAERATAELESLAQDPPKTTSSAPPSPKPGEQSRETNETSTESEPTESESEPIEADSEPISEDSAPTARGRLQTVESVEREDDGARAPAAKAGAAEEVESDDPTSLDEALATEVETLLEGDVEPVESLLDDAEDDAPPSEALRGDAGGDPEDEPEEEPVAVAARAGASREASESSARAAARESKERSKSKSKSKSEAEGDEGEITGGGWFARVMSTARAVGRATGTAARRAWPGVRRGLALVNAPARMLPANRRVILDWVAGSLIFWVPIVWLFVLFG